MIQKSKVKRLLKDMGVLQAIQWPEFAAPISTQSKRNTHIYKL